MGRSNRSSAPSVGHDSFLDIVANLVGVLIILVVVFAAQSSSEMFAHQETLSDDAPLMEPDIEQPEIDEPSIEELTATVQETSKEYEQAELESTKLEVDTRRLEQRISQQDALLLAAKRKRDSLLDLINLAEKEWEKKKSKLDKDAVQLASLNTKKSAAAEELQKLAGYRVRIENRPENEVQVDHLPTPMAKTVFGEEIHLRLRDNRLSVVPLRKLEKKVVEDFRRMASGVPRGNIESEVGPLNGYIASYEVQAEMRSYVTRDGMVRFGSGGQLNSITIRPLQEPHGQPVDVALSENSLLDIELAGRDPRSTTITIWVYPNDYAAFRRIKEILYQRGYATAARVLDVDDPIGMSRHGTKSQAQ